MGRFLKSGCGIGVGLALLALAAVPSGAWAVDAESIVQALQRRSSPLARSTGLPARGVAIEGGEPAVENAASIDLDVPFEYDQSSLSMSDAQITIDTLGRALKDKRLDGLRFALIGHTDARGSDAYNLALSRRRAEAVRARLIQFHGIGPERIQAEGRGYREPRDRANPQAAVNRRVQILSLPTQ